MPILKKGRGLSQESFMEVSQGPIIFLNSLKKRMNNYMKKYANDTKLASVAKIKTGHSVL